MVESGAIGMAKKEPKEEEGLVEEKPEDKIDEYKMKDAMMKNVVDDIVNKFLMGIGRLPKVKPEQDDDLLGPILPTEVKTEWISDAIKKRPHPDASIRREKPVWHGRDGIKSKRKRRRVGDPVIETITINPDDHIDDLPPTESVREAEPDHEELNRPSEQLALVPEDSIETGQELEDHSIANTEKEEALAVVNRHLDELKEGIELPEHKKNSDQETGDDDNDQQIQGTVPTQPFELVPEDKVETDHEFEQSIGGIEKQMSSAMLKRYLDKQKKRIEVPEDKRDSNKRADGDNNGQQELSTDLVTEKDVDGQQEPERTKPQEPIQQKPAKIKMARCNLCGFMTPDEAEIIEHAHVHKKEIMEKKLKNKNSTQVSHPERHPDASTTFESTKQPDPVSKPDFNCSTNDDQSTKFQTPLTSAPRPPLLKPFKRLKPKNLN